MATSSSIFSTHGLTPPRSASRVAGGVWSFAIALLEPVTLALLLFSSPAVVREVRVFLFPFANGERGSGEADSDGSMVTPFKLELVASRLSGAGTFDVTSSSTGGAVIGVVGRGVTAAEELRLTLLLR